MEAIGDAPHLLRARDLIDVRYAERLESVSEQIELAPGEGVHIPPCYPHWVKNGEQVSISLGVLWHSEVTARRRNLYRVNEWMRRFGMAPRRPGEQPLLDAAKVMPFLLKRRVELKLRSARPRPDANASARV